MSNSLTTCCRYLADLVIGHLQDLAASEVLAPFAPAGAGDDWRRAGVHRQREDLQAIGPPLQRNNFANLTEACILDEDFPQHVRPIQVRIQAMHFAQRI